MYHMGVLRRLADDGLLERVTGISTVSGGSLGVSLVMSRSNMKWPTSDEYLSKIYPEIRNVLTNIDLLTLGTGLRGIPRYWRHLITDRAKILADTLIRRWGIKARIKDLPDTPTWWINTTCLETGKNWRFSKREMGDWQFGRHYNPPFLLAEAAAASAAVPYAIGALKANLPADGWYRTDPATRRPLEKVSPPLSTVHLWDGGAYENLGLEALYKPYKSLRGCDFLICSDASGPLRTQTSLWAKLASIARGDLATPRLFDVGSDQIRALRSRMFMGDIAASRIQGALLRMGNSVRHLHIKSGVVAEQTTYDRFLSEEDVARALSLPTGLKAVDASVFDLVARHGYEVADTVLTTHSPANFQKSMRWAA